VTLATQSKDTKGSNHLLAAALVANGISFLQIALLIGTINISFLVQLIPSLIAMVITALILSWYILRNRKEKVLSSKIAKRNMPTSIIDFTSALRFALLYIFIGILTKTAIVFAGNNGFLVAIALGALVGLNAVMIQTAQLAGGTVSHVLAVYAFILANAVNLLGKVFYSYINGARLFALKLLLFFIIIIAASLVGMI